MKLIFVVVCRGMSLLRQLAVTVARLAGRHESWVPARDAGSRLLVRLPATAAFDLETERPFRRPTAGPHGCAELFARDGGRQVAVAACAGLWARHSMRVKNAIAGPVVSMHDMSRFTLETVIDFAIDLV
ncbi:MAG TPA: hypothetical protein VG142_06750 [Trebonia sp.]|nr:hypothetical protein [Trebonia sp.]